MEIKYKLYPYPVLSSYSNDYGTGAFDVAIDIVRDGYDLRIDFLATLTNELRHILWYSPKQSDVILMGVGIEYGLMLLLVLGK